MTTENLFKAAQPRFYIAGPMTGHPEFNHPAFHAKAAELRAQGLDVFNPAENGLPADASWSDHMRVDIRELTHCTHIYMLDGWQASKGARLENRIAHELGMMVLYEGIA